MATTKKAGKGKADAGKKNSSAKPMKSPTSSRSGKEPPRSTPKADKVEPPKRKLGLRGAAPWAARHAAKHAAEARARAAEPAPPGSARATIRTPQGAEDIKQKIALLHQAVGQVKQLRKNLPKGYYEIGLILKDIQNRKLFEAKGFGTFEAFLEREIDLGKTTSLRLIRIVNTFLKEACTEYGMDRIFGALMALEASDTVPEAKPSGKIPPPPVSTSVLPLRPPGR
jgi:hypothetical protein